MRSLQLQTFCIGPLPSFLQLRLHSKQSNCTPCHTRLAFPGPCLATPVLLPLLHFAVLSPADQAACGVALGHHAAMRQKCSLHRWKQRFILAFNTIIGVIELSIYRKLPGLIINLKSAIGCHAYVGCKISWWQIEKLL